MVQVPSNLLKKGLTDEQVIEARKKEGDNRLRLKKTYPVLQLLKSLLTEPMVLILLVASAIYFLTGNVGDGIFLSSAVVLVGAISYFQDSRSRNALEKLKSYTEPLSRVIRNGNVVQIPSEDLVKGDLLMVEEGALIAADGLIVHSNDFSVNESILTGESLAIFKNTSSDDPRVFQGTSAASGLAVAEVVAIGNNTKLGEIGQSLANIAAEQTPLEIQIASFVRKMVIAGAFFFVLVWAINYTSTLNILGSLLKALTLAMSILPEEIPVAFTTFMALGAWRLMKMGIVVKQMKTVETLGSASVLCVDKTGTITQNKMTLVKAYSFETKELFDLRSGADSAALPVDSKNPTPGLSTDSNSSRTSLAQLIRYAMWASEPIPFDPMEVALHEAYHITTLSDERPDYHMAMEYPLEGKPPMMTHVYENQLGGHIIAAKGAPEAIMAVSDLGEDAKKEINRQINDLAAEGYRVLAVARSNFERKILPKIQQQLPFTFMGLVAFYDPPKENMPHVLKSFYRAGIKVKIITGDNALTTEAIARQIGFHGADKYVSGDELIHLTEAELRNVVSEKNIFTRMFPEAKLRIINALKSNGEVVAMTGDGVNDGPALKAAHIGIAMGKKGTEIAKQAASMILTEDDLAKMVEAVKMGRRIYSNLKKAIQYVISIHIPIILIVFIPLLLGWIYPSLFSPIHVIFLELIMGPTCSIIYENEPVEKNIMNQPPRPLSRTFFSGRELLTSVIQGLFITAGLLIVYQYSAQTYFNESITRTMVFSTLITANIFLTLTNRSFYFSMLTTLSYRNKLVPIVIILSIGITAALIYVESFSAFFGFQALSTPQIEIPMLAGFISVLWFEIFKWQQRQNSSNQLVKTPFDNTL